MAEQDFSAARSKLQQLSIAIEQHHQAYLYQQPLILMAKKDHDELLEYAKQVVGFNEPPFSQNGIMPAKELKQVFGAPLKVSKDVEAGTFIVAKVVHYV